MSASDVPQSTETVPNLNPKSVEERADAQEVLEDAPEAPPNASSDAPAVQEAVPEVAVQEAVPEVAVQEAVPEVAVQEAVPEVAEVPQEDAVSPISQLTQDVSFMNLFDSKMQEKEMGAREAVERGLQAFNAIPNACSIITDAVKNVVQDSAKIRYNPEIALLSDFVQHCKMLISVNGPSGLEKEVSGALNAVIAKSEFKSPLFKEISMEQASIHVNLGTRISLILKIGDVFNVPVYSVFVMYNVFDNAKLDSEEATQTILASPMKHNLKTIAMCNRVDLLLELLLHATNPEPYDEVSPLIAHAINDLIVSKFDSTPNEVIQQVLTQCFDLLIGENLTAKSLTTKTTLIAILQNPSVKTPDGKRFFDLFPSGQYVKYLGEIAYKATTDPENKGPIMLPAPVPAPVAVPAAEEVGEAPGYQEPPRPSRPMTRTDIIVAAFTAANDAMGGSSNIVAAGGAAVSYYLADFITGMNADEFGEVIPDSGLDVDALEQLKTNCENIPMNDIDCFVFGEVSRQFLLLFSLYMMILYANFYERPKRYGAMNAVNDIGHDFILSKQSSDNIKLFMYGNVNNDANTRLISKRLKKNPKVQLVTQETKCFSQLSNPVCEKNICSVDSYFTQPIDLVKKEVDDFLILYESLYPEGEGEGDGKPDLRQLLMSQYVNNVDNMVSMKTTMLDLVCIFCNEDKALFIRIFMARKNPKDFSRLRVFIEIYLLHLLRANDSIFLEHKDKLLREIKELREMMSALNKNYYLEQGNIAAVDDSTAEKLIADRNAFLKLLRSIGRTFVLIPDPLNNAVPATFRKETGKNTIAFFKNRQNAQQIKYPFKMDQHMFNLYETYTKATVDSSHEIEMYNAWLNAVFGEIMFASETERMFREKMMKIIDKRQDPLFFQIGFADMPIKTTTMLELLTQLNQVKLDEKLLQDKDMMRHQRRMLVPLRKHILKFGQPKASYVNEIYNKTLLPEFIKTLLNTENQALLKTINAPQKYDEEVNEAIGNIVLEWNQKAPELKGGATRKRKRACKRNANTRRTNKLVGKRRATRKKTCTSGNGKHKRTRRT